MTALEAYIRGKKMILDALLHEQEKAEQEIRCEWCGDEITIMSPEQKILLERDDEKPCCVGCAKEAAFEIEDMWNSLRDDTLDIPWPKI